jgi:ABC-type sulfate/molybdate transport systems ATPase subunit
MGLPFGMISSMFRQDYETEVLDPRETTIRNVAFGLAKVSLQGNLFSCVVLTHLQSRHCQKLSAFYHQRIASDPSIVALQPATGCLNE